MEKDGDMSNKRQMSRLGQSVDGSLLRRTVIDEETSTLAPSMTYPEDLPLSDYDKQRCSKCSHKLTPGSPCCDTPKNPFYEVSNEYMRVSGYAQQFTKLLQKNRKRKPLLPAQPDLPQSTVIDMSPSGYERRFTDHSTAMSLDDEDDDLQKNEVTGSPYGILWKNPPNFKRIKRRKQLFLLKTKACYMAVLFAIIGIACAILEAELIANEYTTKDHYFSHFLRSIIVLTTLILMLLIAWYHIIEIQITIIDSGACDWQVTVTTERIVQFGLELLICCISPFPNHIDINWLVFVEQNHRQVRSVTVPLDSLLILPMFLRCYLLCRFMALRSRQFQDAATRSIASLNRVAVDYKFVLKTMMFEHPLRVLCTFTLTFWVVIAWIFMHCERQTSIKEDNAYLNSIWFIMITFKSIGYGDIVPNTYCGRVLAITAGIVGAAVSSALIAVVSHKLELSRAEKHVNNFMADSKLTRMRKHTAAMVLQHTWFIHKYSELTSSRDEIKLRFHQRRFLASINEFRKVKWDQRKLAEQGNALIDLAKLQNDTYTMIYRMQQSLEKLTNQIDSMRRHKNFSQSPSMRAARFGTPANQSTKNQDLFC